MIPQKEKIPLKENILNKIHKLHNHQNPCNNNIPLQVLQGCHNNKIHLQFNVYSKNLYLKMLRYQFNNQ